MDNDWRSREGQLDKKKKNDNSILDVCRKKWYSFDHKFNTEVKRGLIWYEVYKMPKFVWSYFSDLEIKSPSTNFSTESALNNAPPPPTPHPTHTQLFLKNTELPDSM